MTHARVYGDARPTGMHGRDTFLYRDLDKKWPPRPGVLGRGLPQQAQGSFRLNTPWHLGNRSRSPLDSIPLGPWLIPPGDYRT